MIELECIPFGVGHADEGVCLLVRMGPYRILLDCGLKDISSLQNLKIPANQPFKSAQSDLPADLLLCSHAHPDHARGLLALHQTFPQLPIYASEVTTHLLPLNWPELELAEIPLLCQALPWRSPIEFGDGLSAELLPAGHLPGAAAFLLTYTPPQTRGNTSRRSYTLLYTGDFFLSNSRLVEGLPLADFRELAPDVLIIEGTFGTARHPHRRQQENQLAERISQAFIQGFSVILPVPVFGLGQELLMLLRSHHYFTGRDLDIWVDQAIAAGCDAYLQILPHLPTTVQNFAQHQPLFWDQRVRPRVQRLEPEQHQFASQSPCIILCDKPVDVSQYCHAVEHSWLLLLPQRPGQVSPLAQSRANSAPPLVDPVMDAITRFQPQIQAGQLKVETYLLAQHCDGPGTTQMIHNLRPQHVIFVHGSPTYLADLTSLDELNNRYHLHCPGVGTRVELPIGEGLLQPNPTLETVASYEGELNEFGTVITITLPEAIAADPRWQQFADTGLVEASWQGEALVLQGLSQRELLLGQGHYVMSDVSCCATCQHYRGQRCWNRASSLFGFKVTPEGYCPAFEPLRSPETKDNRPN
jgi:Cft2 family RNA processing exonuclease